ncbi:phage tail protein [Paenibacillus sp. UNC499MF]|uniref:phage tail protein n=1 Tax=Paenibacillus sp. UNC499MF TaxID=1502751 RepID=UPI00089F98A5|nr:tail fiber protein [Paenibacillus sp. UNC499MF]SEG73904.1 Microcystin-dependent protein [Paenibacillus sp. UNC499MF]
MSESYLGEIRMFGGNYPPQGWALCNGQILNIAENEALYALLGTTYGGDGQTTFGLPDLQGRIPVHPSQGYIRGSKSGTETVTLTQPQLPQHNHIPFATSTPATANSPVNNTWATAITQNYATSGTTTSMSSQAISTVGGNQPHNNVMPSAVITFIISLYGVFPPQP